MQINQISLYQTYNNYNKSLKSENTYLYKTQQKKQTPQPSFAGHIDTHKIIRKLGLNPIFHFKDFTPEEYHLLTEKELGILREKYQKLKTNLKIYQEFEYKEIEDYHQYVANSVRKTFDEQFGKDNYVVIFIGRSLSSIGKVLGYQIGEKNVLNIPLSNADRYFSENKITQIKKDGTFEAFSRYLNENKLSKKDVLNSNKHYIITDYIFSGASMKGIKKLFANVWGKNCPNVLFTDVTQNIPNLPNHKDLRKYYLREMLFKDLAFVDRCEDLFTVSSNNKRSTLFAPKEIKLLWFKLLDNEMVKKKSHLDKYE